MIKPRLNNPAVRQFARYLLVGVMNTLVTLAVIYLCKGVLEVNQWVSNGIGYVAGLVNSFVWNKTWVFHSRGKGYAEAVKFAIGFIVCYGIQLGVTWVLVTPMELGGIVWHIGFWTMSGYGLATLVGMGVYTMCNFVYNRLVTFTGN